MKIISIHFLNLNSLKGEHEIRFDAPPFTESGLFAITGPTGAGKTTILDAITVGLYGRVHRHDKDASESMTRFTGETFAEVEFEVNDKLYRAKWSIRRSRNKPGGALQTAKMELADAVTGDIIVAHPLVAVQNKIVEICGLDYNQFLRSVMLSQGDFTRFLRASENERSELLEKMTDTGIYSRISAFVFDKAREQKALLDALRAKMNDVVLLSDEEKSAITASLQQQKEEEARLKQIRQAAETKINWLQKIKGLEDKKQLHRADLLHYQQQAKDNEPLFERLHQHSKAAVYRLPLQAVNEQNKQKKEIESKIEGLEKQLSVFKEQTEQALTQSEAAANVYNTAQITLFETEPLLEAVIIKDTEIEGKRKQVDEITKAFTALQKEVESGYLLSQQKQHELAVVKLKIADAENWLEMHEKERNLEKDLPQYQQIIKELAVADEAIVKATKELKKFESQHKAEQTDLAKSVEKVGVIKKVIAELQAKQSVNTQKLQEATGEQTVEAIEAQSSSLPALIAVCKDQLRLSSEYQKHFDRRQHVTQQLETSNKKYRDESEQLKQLEIDKEKAESALTDLQQLVELQIRIQKYDEARRQLEPEKPCPLCGSVHHPFVENYDKSQVNQAEQKRKAHKTFLDALLKTFSANTLSVNTLFNNITTDKKELEQLEITISEVLAAFKNNNKELPKPLTIQDSRIITAIIATKESDYKRLRAQITSLRNLQKEAADVESQVNSKKHELAKTESVVLQMGERIKAIQRDLERTNKEVETATINWENILETAAKLISFYGITFHSNEAFAVEEELRKRYENFETSLKNLQQLKIDIGRLEAESISTKEAHTERKARLEEQELSLSAEQANLKELQLARHQLFGEKDPSKERKRLNEVLQQSKNLLDKLQTELHQKQQALKVSEEKSKDWQSQLKKVSENYYVLYEQLIQKLQAEGIVSIEALESLFISLEEEQRITLLKQQIEKDITAIIGIIKSLEEEHIAEVEKNLTAESEAALIAFRAEQEELISALNQQIGSLQHKLEEDAQTLAKHKEVAVQVEVQQKECSRWDKISQLIGSADGKKFSKFAQGLTLARLTELANRHLHKLSDRYRILKSAEKDLELQIIDAYQAEVVRPMTTLSGGESFLVSLSLALGLSDLAGSKTQINSLFIDEGFGTLDAETLDVAISALENLQASGKMIGIISHVEALKERIGTQIEVSKQPGGYSKIKVRSYGREYA